MQTPSKADEPKRERFSRIAVTLTGPVTLERLVRAGIDLEGASAADGSGLHPGKFGSGTADGQDVIDVQDVLELTASESDLKALDAIGVGYTVLQADQAARVPDGLLPGPFDALGFGMGSMGGYYTYLEIGEQLDSMRLLHPSRVGEKQVIGYTHEGRELWAVKISDNPDSDEPGEPEALYTALTHAREPAGMMTVIYYMWWLLEEYGSDADATYLVDNRQLWFIPVINADGYVYNQTTNPSGGGLWRKNRRPNGGSYGVDPNRNYGPFDMWDAPNGGSSTDPNSSTYRGPSPFSEPENQAIDNFMRSHSIMTALNYHTYGRLLVFPWGYLSAESADSLIYREYGFELSRVNRYVSGTDQQTVGYSTRGNSDDYMYGDLTKQRTYSLTPEAGTSFWPPSTSILPIAQENLRANIYFSYAAGAAPSLHSSSVADSSGDGSLDAGEAFAVTAKLSNPGLGAGGPYTVTFAPISGALSAAGPPVVVWNLAERSDTVVSLAGRADEADGPPAMAAITIEGPGGYFNSDTILVYPGAAVTLLEDDAEAGIGGWTVSGNWGLSSEAWSGGASFHDSPSGTYGPGVSWTLQTSTPIPLGLYSGASLEFMTKWAIEPSYDMGRVEISNDGGENWTEVWSSLSNPGSGQGAQNFGSWGYDGYTPGLDWRRQEFDLTPWTGADALIRFRLSSDGGEQRDGWYIDDIVVRGYMGQSNISTLTLAAAGGDTVRLEFGEHPLGTPGLDLDLGETPLDDPPPGGVFDARWLAPPTNGLTTQIVGYPVSPPDSSEFIVAIDASPSDFPVSLRWERSRFSPGSWVLLDGPGGSPLADMWMTDRHSLSDDATTTVVIRHTLVDSADLGLTAGWEIVSAPVDGGAVPPDSIFSGASSGPYLFDGGYFAPGLIEAGAGYWVKYDDPGLIRLSGVPFSSTVFQPDSAGWHLIGAAWCPVPAASLCPGCDEAPDIYGYEGGYYLADTLEPGKGYWYKGSGPVTISCLAYTPVPAPAAPVAGGPESRRPADPPSGRHLSTLKFRSPSGRNVELYFSAAAGELRPLPPPPPAGGFDARFESHSLVEYFSTSGASQFSERGSREILLSGTRGPVTIDWEITGGQRGFALTSTPLFPDRSDGAAARPLDVALVGSGSVTIDDPASARIYLTHDPGPGAPRQYALYQNYPNPFNPSTAISFDLGSDARVTLTVSNILGQEVDEIISDSPFPAGRHAVSFDAGGLASGVYVYTLTASPGPGTPALRLSKKFLLLK